MTTGGKIAVGCGVAVLLAVIIAVAGVFGLAWWGKGKLEEVTGGPGGIERMAKVQEEVQRYQAEANRNEFAQPADGVIQEERLLKFLAVRRDVFAVYEKYRAEIEALGKSGTPDLGAIAKSVHLVNDLRLTQAKAQAREGVSEGEYGWLVGQVYKTAWAAGLAKETGGKRTSEAARAVLGQAGEQIRKQLENPNLTEDQRRQLEQALAQLEQQGEAAVEAAGQLDVPPANLELFERHRAEIEKYAMGGLELLGL
jgi:hypothetical protein